LAAVAIQSLVERTRRWWQDGQKWRPLQVKPETRSPQRRKVSTVAVAAGWSGQEWVASTFAINPPLNSLWDWREGGLDINDSAQKYTLTSMPGHFSGLHLVSLIDVGFRQIDPSLDGGIDLSKEFVEAEKLAMIM
jgi:hypothetical protein